MKFNNWVTVSDVTGIDLSKIKSSGPRELGIQVTVAVFGAVKEVIWSPLYTQLELDMVRPIKRITFTDYIYDSSLISIS